MLSRRLPRLALSVLLASSLLLVACSDDDDDPAGDPTSTPSFTVPPRTDGPGRPTGDAALQDALLTKEEVNADVDEDDPADFQNNLFTFGVATPDDEIDFCDEPSPLRDSAPVSEAQVSFQDFLGGEIDQRILRYASPERASEVLAAVREAFEACEQWLWVDDLDRDVQVNSQDVDIPIGVEVDEELSVNVLLRLEGVVAVNNYLLVRDGADLVRLRTSYGQGKQRLAGDWIDRALEKLRAQPA